MTATTNLGKLGELQHQVSMLQRFALEDPTQLKLLLPSVLEKLQGSLREWEAAAPVTGGEFSNGQHAQDHRLDQAQRFRAMSDQEQILVRIMGDADHCRWVNQAWRVLTGRSTKELLGEGWLRYIHSDDREQYAQSCREALESGRLHRMEYRLQHPDGEYGWVLEIGSPLTDARGGIRGFVGVATEIREHKQSQARPELEVALAQVLAQSRHAGANGHNGNGNGNGNGSRPRD